MPDIEILSIGVMESGEWHCALWLGNYSLGHRSSIPIGCWPAINQITRISTCQILHVQFQSHTPAYHRVGLSLTSKHPDDDKGNERVITSEWGTATCHHAACRWLKWKSIITIVEGEGLSGNIFTPSLPLTYCSTTESKHLVVCGPQPHSPHRYSV